MQTANREIRYVIILNISEYSLTKVEIDAKDGSSIGESPETPQNIIRSHSLLLLLHHSQMKPNQ